MAGTYRELGTRLFDVLLERREVLTVPMQVDVVESAAGARLDHLLQPVETLAGVCAGGDGGERPLDREGLDVLLVPGGRLAGRDATGVGLVQRKHGWELVR